jgi:hypothetical protein
MGWAGRLSVLARFALLLETNGGNKMADTLDKTGNFIVTYERAPLRNPAHKPDYENLTLRGLTPAHASGNPPIEKTIIGIDIPVNDLSLEQIAASLVTARQTRREQWD